MLTSGTFEGQIALQQTQTTNLTGTGNGASVPLGAVRTSHYSPADYAPLGGASVAEYEVADPGGTYPTAAKVGDKGLVGTVKLYSDSTKIPQIGSEARRDDTRECRLRDLVFLEYAADYRATLSGIAVVRKESRCGSFWRA